MTSQGSERTAYSIKEIRAKEMLVQLMRRARLSVSIDGVGNVFGRTKGSGPALMMGSHIDSVPGGGRFDGVVGVASALEAVQSILEHRIQIRHPLEVCGFSAEESSRFGVGTMGSAVMTGELNAEEVMGLRDRHGVTLEQALARLGLTEKDVSRSQRKPNELLGYLELHVEQGPVLETSGKKIGVVKAIAAPTRIRISFLGRADHSGTTPMNLRRDALVAASELVLAVEDICRSQVRDVVGTVGMMTIKPNAMNVVPGNVEMGIDIRGISFKTKSEASHLVIDKANEIAKRRRLDVDVSVLREEEPVELDADMISLLEEVCKSMGVPYMLMTSGAGHDAMNMAKITKAGMIFIPSHMGLSHNPEEWTDLSDVELGANCLLQAALKLVAE
jgi:N-carbamoyl-L-amino-acid hydrolase